MYLLLFKPQTFLSGQLSGANSGFDTKKEIKIKLLVIKEFQPGVKPPA